MWRILGKTGPSKVPEVTVTYSENTATLEKKNSTGDSLFTQTETETASIRKDSGPGNELLLDGESLDLWTIWGELVNNWSAEMKRRPLFIKDLVQKGIPIHFRTIAWQLLSGAESEIENSDNANSRQLYRDYLRGHSAHEKCYSMHDKEVGYCQGTAFIAGQLLMQWVHPKMPEEETFLVYVRLMENYGLRNLYRPSMTELGLRLHQLDSLIEEFLPVLKQHFNSVGLDVGMFASSWFLTLFTSNAPIEFANRIMDVFLLEGIDITLKVSLAILISSENDLHRLNMEQILKFLQKYLSLECDSDYEPMLQSAFQIKINQKKMRRLEKEFYNKKSRQNEEDIQLRSLRNENKIYKERIERLERETCSLAERLIKGQVRLADQTEHCLLISYELEQMKKEKSDLMRKMQMAGMGLINPNLKSASESQTMEKSAKMSFEEGIRDLQKKLILGGQSEDKLKEKIEELQITVEKLTKENKELADNSNEDSITALQDELISVKMHDAEAEMCLKELKQKLGDLEKQWANYIKSRVESQNITNEENPKYHELDRRKSASPDSQSSVRHPEIKKLPHHHSHLLSAEEPTVKRSFSSSLLSVWDRDKSSGGDKPKTPVEKLKDCELHLTEMEDQMMGVRIREADTLIELKTIQHRVMELEAQNHVAYNQVKRQENEIRTCNETIDEVNQKLVDAQNELKDQTQRADTIESEMNEKAIMYRLKLSEHQQTICELEAKIVDFEAKATDTLLKSKIKSQVEKTKEILLNGDPTFLGCGENEEFGQVSLTPVERLKMWSFSTESQSPK